MRVADADVRQWYADEAAKFKEFNSSKVQGPKGKVQIVQEFKKFKMAEGQSSRVQKFKSSRGRARSALNALNRLNP